MENFPLSLWKVCNVSQSTKEKLLEIQKRELFYLLTEVSLTTGVYQRISVIDWGPVHTYPNVFESATFSFGIQKFPHSHVIRFVADLLFSTLEADSVDDIQIRRIREEGSRMRKEKVAD